jgi:glycopeptide antibiotics resistance protein
MDGFWDLFWWAFWAFVFVAYLIVLFWIVVDLFRDHTLNGWLKAVWLIFLVFVPFITGLVYIVTRGRAMAERSGDGIGGGEPLHTSQSDFFSR